MPRFEEDMQVNTANGNYNYSAVKIDKLAGESSEFTLVTIVIDVTGSVYGFEDQLLKTTKAVIDSCNSNQRNDQLMVRVMTFNTSVDEIHGFKLLNMIDVDNDYKPFSPGGITALYDATEDAISATLSYAEDLYDQDYDTNGIIAIITDGYDNASQLASPSSIKTMLGSLITDERKIESLNTILIGVNASYYGSELSKFKDNAGLTQYVDAGDATPENLAKVANFISQSISSQSESLGTGGPSQSLTF